MEQKEIEYSYNSNMRLEESFSQRQILKLKKE